MNERMINLAARIATDVCDGKSRNGTFKHCAIIHRNSKILGIGISRPTVTHPLSQTRKFNICRHAELDAIIKVRHRDLTKCEITVVRVDNIHHKPVMSKPCDNCMELLAGFGIKVVHYSDEQGKCKTIKIGV